MQLAFSDLVRVSVKGVAYTPICDSCSEIRSITRLQVTVEYTQARDQHLIYSVSVPFIIAACVEQNPRSLLSSYQSFSIPLSAVWNNFCTIEENKTQATAHHSSSTRFPFTYCGRGRTHTVIEAIFDEIGVPFQGKHLFLTYKIKWTNCYSRKVKLICIFLCYDGIYGPAVVLNQRTVCCVQKVGRECQQNKKPANPGPEWSLPEHVANTMYRSGICKIDPHF